jgi:mono/diheme cytochrome c family protein
VRLPATTAAFAFALVAAVLLAPAFHVRAAGASITFTSGQVASGAKAFALHCAACHGTQLEGGAGPALSGPNFKTLSSKVHASVSDIFTYMTTNMPMNAPASLPHADYVNILAFILSKNGYQAGSSSLTYAAAKASSAAIVH